MIDILTLIQTDGFTLKKVSMTNGGEYCGPCPFCGTGRDRFHVQPYHNGGRWFCRQCRKSGDAIRYLREYRGMTYRDARRLVSRMQRQPLSAAPPSRRLGQGRIEEMVRSGLWSEQAAIFLEVFQEHLWTDHGEDARDFLHSRGLTDDTIKDAGLGLNILDRYRPRESWGLPVEAGGPIKVKAPAGLVIPHIVNGAIQRLRVRLMEKDADPRYSLVSGSSTSPMVFPCRGALARSVVIVESELDALLVNQCSGDLITTIALGSSTIKPDTQTQRLLQQSKLILIALDADEAGRKSASQYWLPTYPIAKRWPVPVGKDQSDALQKGLDIRQWIVAGLSDSNDIPESWHDNLIPFPSEYLGRYSDEQLERLSLMTIDGELTDDEAIQQLDGEK